MGSKLLLNREYHRKVQEVINLQGTEDYAVVTHRRHGDWLRSIHVFTRTPTTKELNKFENTSSKTKFRGRNMEMESGSAQAAEELYNKLIDRTYDLPIGAHQIKGEVTKHPDGTITGKPLSAEEARNIVPPMVKREALRDFIGEVYSESRLEDREGDEEEPAKDKEED